MWVKLKTIRGPIVWRLWTNKAKSRIRRKREGVGIGGRGSFGKVYIVRFSYPSFELARWRNSVHSASRVTLVRVYAGHAAGRDLGAAAAMLI